MHPMQLSSFAVYIANQPSRLAALRHANTSTGHTARQKPHALHMSSETTTSHFPAGPRDVFFSTLNSAIAAPWCASMRSGRPRIAVGPLKLHSSLSEDLRVDAGWDHAVHGERLGHVLEGPLPEALEHEAVADALRRRRAHHDLSTLGGAGQARGHVGGRSGRREGPALGAGATELGRAHERLP